MKVGILGSGDVGQALGKGFISLGHQVMIGSRDGANPRVAGFVKESNGKASQGTFSEAARFGEVIVIATLGTAATSVIDLAKAENFSGKTIIDATNPLDFVQGSPVLVGGLGTSGGETIQKALKGANVVKAFNTVGNALFFRPNLKSGTPDMFICGDNPAAKEKVADICKDFGWGVIDVGGISASHYLESMCLIWVLTAMKNGTWTQAFKLLRQ